ncbi:hypothetical protein LSH36_283g03032, partial [Paralvinella palmiformis]
TSVVFCLLCPEGFFCPTGSFEPQTCPPGFYCTYSQPTGYSNPCPLGTYSDTSGLNNGSQCLDCPAGSYCPYGSETDHRTTPINCPAGTFNPDEKSGHELNCRDCPGGFACPDVGQTNYTVPCMEGHYCPN